MPKELPTTTAIKFDEIHLAQHWTPIMKWITLIFIVLKDERDT